MKVTTETPLPKLMRPSARHDLAGLSPDWSSLFDDAKAKFAQAVTDRSEAERYGPAALEQAQAVDRDALLEAARKGKPDPGRKAEMKFAKEADVARRRAESSTLLANEAAAALTTAVKVAAAEGQPKEIAERLAALDEAKREHAEALAGILAEGDGVRGLAAMFEQVARNGAPHGLPSGSAGSLSIVGHGQGLRATLACEQLAELDLGAES